MSLIHTFEVGDVFRWYYGDELDLVVAKFADNDFLVLSANGKIHKFWFLPHGKVPAKILT